MFANRIGSSTSCSIWLPETSPPSSARSVLRHRLQSCNTSFRADAAFAKPEIYEALEERGVKYAICIPANDSL